MKSLARWALCLLLILIILIATAETGVSLPLENGDKVLHFISFYVLAFLMDFAFPQKGFGAIKIIMLLAYGLAIEFLQSFLPYRSSELGDFFADVAGVYAYVLFIPLMLHIPLYRKYRSSSV